MTMYEQLSWWVCVRVCACAVKSHKPWHEQTTRIRNGHFLRKKEHSSNERRQAENPRGGWGEWPNIIFRLYELESDHHSVLVCHGKEVSLSLHIWEPHFPDHCLLSPTRCLPDLARSVQGNVVCEPQPVLMRQYGEVGVLSCTLQNVCLLCLAVIHIT